MRARLAARPRPVAEAAAGAELEPARQAAAVAWHCSARPPILPELASVAGWLPDRRGGVVETWFAISIVGDDLAGTAVVRRRHFTGIERPEQGSEVARHCIRLRPGAAIVDHLRQRRSQVGHVVRP